MSRRPVMAGNWKMYKNREDTQITCRRMLELVEGVEDTEIVLFPAFTSLAAAWEILNGTAIGLGAQNVHWENEGAYTGEVSIPMLIDAGCRYVILGHSERRQYFKETDEMVNRKMERVSKTALTPILCVGETLDQRETGRAQEVVLGQLEKALDGLTDSELSRMMIAYEPVWAIGTGMTATPEVAQEVHYMIRNWLGGRFSSELPGKVRILYGGSVKPSNVGELMAQDDIDGALVGGASLEAESFAKLVRYRG